MANRTGSFSDIESESELANDHQNHKLRSPPRTRQKRTPKQKQTPKADKAKSKQKGVTPTCSSEQHQHRDYAEVVKSLLTDELFKNILRESIASAVSKCITRVESELSSAIDKNKVCIEQQQGNLHDIQIRMDSFSEHSANFDASVDGVKSSLAKMESELEDLKQYSRRNSIRILGVAESADENTDQLAIQLFEKHLGINLLPAVIDRSHRVGKPRPSKLTPPENVAGQAKAASSSTPSQDEQIKSKIQTRPILVKFCSYRHKRAVMSKKSLLKNTGFMIVEDLTNRNFNLLMETRNSTKVESAWTIDGKVFAAVKTTGSKPMKKIVTSMDQLKLL